MSLLSGSLRPYIAGVIVLLLITALINILGLNRLLDPYVLGIPRNLQSDESQLEILKAENQSLLVELSQLGIVRQENVELRELLVFADRQPYESVASHVIARDPLNRTHIIIDKGADSNIKKGQPVIIGDGVLIGKVLAVSDQRSTVELITSDFSRLAVTIQGSGLTRGVTRGDLATALKVEFIPPETAFEVSDIIVTSGLELYIPEGLLIGTIQKILRTPDDFFVEADATPAADLSRLTIVSVITKL